MKISFNNFQNKLHDNLIQDLENISKIRDDLISDNKNTFLAKCVTSLKFLKGTAKAIAILTLDVFIALLRLPVCLLKRDLKALNATRILAVAAIAVFSFVGVFFPSIVAGMFSDK